MVNQASKSTYPLFNTEPQSTVSVSGKEISYFNTGNGNIDIATVEAFGDEWSKFDHFSDEEIEAIASTHYFDIVDKLYLTGKSVLDVGCGTGRWTKYAAKYARTVDAIDPSKAIISAAKLLASTNNVRLSQASVDTLPFENESFDFVFSLGVLHHIPNTALAMKQCIAKVKPGGFFLTYLYYKLDGRGVVFRQIFNLSNFFRRRIAAMPISRRNFCCDAIALLVYLPLIFVSSIFKQIGLKKISKKIPLHFYVGKTFNVIRNDARDRFGTPLEQRYSKAEINTMMEDAGLTNIVFSENEPYWHAIGQKK